MVARSNEQMHLFVAERIQHQIFLSTLTYSKKQNKKIGNGDAPLEVLTRSSTSHSFLSQFGRLYKNKSKVCKELK